MNNIAKAQTDFEAKDWLNFGYDVGSVFGIFFYGDVPGNKLNKATKASHLIQIAAGLEKSLQNEDLIGYERKIAYLDQVTLNEIIVRYVESGKLVDMQWTYQEGKFEQFGEALGDFIKFSFKVAEVNHKAFLDRNE